MGYKWILLNLWRIPMFKLFKKLFYLSPFRKLFMTNSDAPVYFEDVKLLASTIVAPRKY